MEIGGVVYNLVLEKRGANRAFAGENRGDWSSRERLIELIISSTFPLVSSPFLKGGRAKVLVRRCMLPRSFLV